MNVKIQPSSNVTPHINSYSVQALRSASYWSVGLDLKYEEKSILKTYEELIDNSKYHIMIENQFFVSKSFRDDENINENKNSIVSSMVVNE